MKYSNEKALCEIRRRSEQIILKKKREVCQKLAGISSALFITLIAAISFLTEEVSINSSKSVYGAFLLGEEAGGYVLVAFIAFVLGITVCLLCLRHRNRGDPKNDGTQTNN